MAEDLRVCVDKALLELTFGLDSGILHIFKVLGHILHLVAQVGKVWVFLFLGFDHFN